MTQTDLTRQYFTQQLAALGVARYEFCLVDANSGRAERHLWSASHALSRLSWLKHRNASEWHIYLRPETCEPIVLVDDLSHAGVEAMRADGLGALCIVESSPDNFQAWVRVAESPIPHELATGIGEVLATRYEADLRAKSFRQPGRAVGFTNVKPKHKLPNGLFPFVRLHEASGQSAQKPAALVDSARALLKERRASRAQIRNRYLKRSRRVGLEDPQSFFENAVAYICKQYGADTDLSRADAAAARRMLTHGYAAADVATAMLRSEAIHDRRGHRVADYVDRTVAWAVDHVG
ncbi:MAG: DNA-primase RepB domain-containing protein [Parvibaculaceae bacterium]